MSCCNFSINGYGVYEKCGTVHSVSDYKAVSAMCPKLEKELEEFFVQAGIKNPSAEDYDVFFMDADNSDGDFLALVARVIRENEGIVFFSGKDVGGDNFLLFEPNYPWTMDDRERGLTKEYVEEVLRRYYGPFAKDFNADYLSCEETD